MRRHTFTGLVLTMCALAAQAAAGAQQALEAMRRGDYAAAYPLWVELAEAGDDKAAIEVGLMHHLGRGRAVDYGAAYGWYAKVLHSNGDAWNNIGVLFRDGLGVPRNRKIAHLMFLTVHMTGMGSEATVMRANRNLRREIAELPQQERLESLCYPQDYLRAYVSSQGTLAGVPEAYRASPQRPRIRDLSWWLPGELPAFDCPAGS
jgi:hypothetical protein